MLGKYAYLLVLLLVFPCLFLLMFEFIGWRSGRILSRWSDLRGEFVVTLVGAQGIPARVELEESERDLAGRRRGRV